MKKILSVAAICLSLTACTKAVDYYGTHTTPIDDSIKNPIEVDLYMLFADNLSYRIVTSKDSTFGQNWYANIPLASPVVADTGTFTIEDLSDNWEETYGTAKFKVMRNPRIADSKTMFHGTGTWYLIEATGSYSYLKLAKGNLTYTEDTTPQEEGGVDSQTLEYNLKGFSN